MICRIVCVGRAGGDWWLVAGELFVCSCRHKNVCVCLFVWFAWPGRCLELITLQCHSDCSINFGIMLLCMLGWWELMGCGGSSIGALLNRNVYTDSAGWYIYIYTSYWKLNQLQLLALFNDYHRLLAILYWSLLANMFGYSNEIRISMVHLTGYACVVIHHANMKTHIPIWAIKI